MRQLVVGLLVAFGSIHAAGAKTLYVDPQTGNDATPYAENSQAMPWRTITRASAGSADRNAPNAGQAARAGDVVAIAGGTYTTVGNMTGGGGGRQDVAYNPINSGTADAPIRFECRGTCVLTYSSGAGPMIGATERNYIEWSGFTISETTAPTRSDTGPVTFFRVTGGAIENSVLTGNPNWPERVGDNYNGVRLEDALGVRIVNNLIRDYGGGGPNPDRNHSGITTYRSYPITILNNEIVNCGAGIYLKGTSPASVVRAGRVAFNVFRENRLGLMVLQQPMTAENPLLIHQNLFIANREAGLWVNMFDNGAYDAKWVRFINNTLVNNVAAMASYNNAVFPRGANILHQNNLVAGTGNAIRQDTSDARANNLADVQRFDRNVYQSQRFEMGGDVRNLGFMRGLGHDANSVVAQPGFVSATDYHLTPTSPARTVGRAVHGIGGADGTTIPAGAYITGDEVIGRTSAGAPPPSPPR